VTQKDRQAVPTITKEAHMPGSMTRWDPFSELTELRGPWERLLDALPFDGRQQWMPAIDVERSNGDLMVRADIPGIKPEEVKIEIADNVLTVSGEHRDATEKKDKHYLRRERRYGAFSRSVSLPDGVDASKVKATTHDGVVEVTVPLPKGAKKERVQITPTAA
jgi:HSP20 family protein